MKKRKCQNTKHRFWPNIFRFFLPHIRNDFSQSWLCLFLIFLCDLLSVMWGGLLSRVSLDAMASADKSGLLSPLIICLLFLPIFVTLSLVFTSLYFRKTKIRIRIYRNSGMSRQELSGVFAIERFLLWLGSFLIGLGLDTLIFGIVNRFGKPLYDNVMLAYLNWPMVGLVVCFSFPAPLLAFFLGAIRFRSHYDIPFRKRTQKA